MPLENIVNNSSKAYGYNYASLGDIARAGHKIPQMRIKPTDNGEYVEYLDSKGEWQIGAKVVVPDMKGSNDAQQYGAAQIIRRGLRKGFVDHFGIGLACAHFGRSARGRQKRGRGNEIYRVLSFRFLFACGRLYG